MLLLSSSLVKSIVGSIFIIKGFRIIVFIFIVIFTTFRAICPPAFFNKYPIGTDPIQYIENEKGWRTYRPKRCGNNNKDEDNCPKTLNDKNHQASSQKFRQLSYYFVLFIYNIC